MRALLPTVLVALVVLLPYGAAQGVVGPVAAAEVAPAALDLDHGGAAEVVVTVTNQGQVAGDLAVDASAEGDLAVRLLDVPDALAAGESADVRAEVSAPEGVVSDAGLPVTFSVALSGGAGGVSRDTATLTVAVAAAPVPAATPPPPPVGLYAAAGAAVAGLLAAVVAAAVVWPRERALVVTCAEVRRDVRSGAEAFYRVDVRNRWRRPAIVEVALKEVPRGWTVGTDVSRLVVEPRGEGTVCVAVRAPPEAPDGAVGEIVLEVRHALARVARAEVSLGATVVDPVVRRRPVAVVTPEAA